ncbi:hypothetical protein [Phenylobacterium sp.]|uniref:hypothetical protein n=1 Tax=Phenylobacterium sp. TaxID=1871053 RepID=UPI0035B40736
MTTCSPNPSTSASAAYAALRHGGSPPGVASVQLGLDRDVALRLERSFIRRAGGGHHAMRPRFAHHDLHVGQVLAQGGYPAMPDRSR